MIAAGINIHLLRLIVMYDYCTKMKNILILTQRFTFTIYDVTFIM